MNIPFQCCDITNFWFNMNHMDGNGLMLDGTEYNLGLSEKQPTSIK